MERVDKNNDKKVKENSEDCYDKTLTINKETDTEECLSLLWSCYW